MTDENIEAWRKIWRDGLAPVLSIPSLEALRRALAEDDPNLIQGATCTPAPLQCMADHPVTGACAVSYCGWRGDDRLTVNDVEEYFAEICFDSDRRLGEPGRTGYFMEWFDSTPREQMRVQLLTEVERTLKERMPNHATTQTSIG